MKEQEQAKGNLSHIAQNLPQRNTLNIINGKIIFKGSDVLKAMGIDCIG